ncbi:snaclec bitiscetin subunit alpha-like [Festucalex cinctus]
MTFALGLSLFICGISQLFTGASARLALPSTSDRCPPGWTQLNRRCFILQGAPLTFDLAEIACKLLGGNLASIQSDMELAVANELTTLTLDATGIWIGLKAEATLLTWTDGSSTAFASSQFSTLPDGCVVIRTNDGVWDVISCGAENPYICGRDIFQCVSICAQEAQESNVQPL